MCPGFVESEAVHVAVYIEAFECAAYACKVGQGGAEYLVQTVVYSVHITDNK